MTHHNLDEIEKAQQAQREKEQPYEEFAEGGGTDAPGNAMSATSVQPKKGKGKGKGKGKSKGGGSKKGSGGKKGRGQTSPGVPRALKDKLVCSSCANPMTMSTKINYEEIPGKKIPKGADGKTPAFKSLGSSGKIVGVLCDDCLRNLEAGSPITLKTAAVEKPDGTIANVSVSRLPDQ